MARRELQLEPFLKWPGGKRWLAPFLAEVLRAELNGTYYEPFLGAGAVFLQILPDSAMLSDTNRELVTFLKTIQANPEEVVRAVWRWSNTEECYYTIRDSRPRTTIGRAARFLYLNRTCWGGIYRTNQRGDFNVPFGNSGRRLCSLQHVRDVAGALCGATLSADDFEAAIDIAAKGDVIYADPPYTAKGENNGFIRYNEKLFSWKDQERLARACRRARHRGVFVAVSGLQHDELLKLYEGWWVVTIKRHSRVSRDSEYRRHVSEVVIFSRRPACHVESRGHSLKRIDVA